MRYLSEKRISSKFNNSNVDVYILSYLLKSLIFFTSFESRKMLAEEEENLTGSTTIELRCFVSFGSIPSIASTRSVGAYR